MKIFFKSECIIAASIVYRRPKLNVPVFIQSLDRFLTDSQERNLMVMGDINIDLLKKKTDQTSRDYLNVLQSHGMVSLFNNPTREELIRNSVVKSTLDHIFVRTPKSITCTLAL